MNPSCDQDPKHEPRPHGAQPQTDYIHNLHLVVLADSSWKKKGKTTAPRGAPGGRGSIAGIQRPIGIKV